MQASETELAVARHDAAIWVGDLAYLCDPLNVPLSAV